MSTLLLSSCLLIGAACLSGCSSKQENGEIFQMTEACMKAKQGITIRFEPQKENSSEQSIDAK